LTLREFPKAIFSKGPLPSKPPFGGGDIPLRPNPAPRVPIKGYSPHKPHKGFHTRGNFPSKPFVGKIGVKLGFNLPFPLEGQKALPKALEPPKASQSLGNLPRVFSTKSLKFLGPPWEFQFPKISQSFQV